MLKEGQTGQIPEHIESTGTVAQRRSSRGQWTGRRSADEPAWDKPPVWIHGDLHGGNLLTADGRLSAVIDFGGLGVGDPACDLMAAWMFLSAETRPTFRAELGVDDATWARGRGWGMVLSLPSPDDLAADERYAAAFPRWVDELLANAR